MKAKTCKQYLSELKKKNIEQGGTGTAYALARMLQMSDARISNYTTGKKLFDDEMCFKTAFILGLNPAEVIANVNAERAAGGKKAAFWEDILTKMKSTAATFILALFFAAPSIFPSRVEAGQFNINQITRPQVADNIHYTNQCGRHIIRNILFRTCQLCTMMFICVLAL